MSAISIISFYVDAGFIMYSHAKLSAPPPSFNPVIKGIPELTPLLSTESKSASGR